MPDIYEIADNLGVGDDIDVGNNIDGSTDENDFLGNAAIEDRISDLFGEETSKEQPNADNPEVPAGKSTETNKDEGNQNKEPEPVKETVTFEDASKNVFMDSDGSLSSERIEDVFINKDKFSVDLSSIPTNSVDNDNAIEEPETPEAKYYKDVSEILDSLPEIIKDESGKGFTAEQTLQRLINTFNGFGSDRKAREEILSERDSLSKQFKSELEQVREDKLMSRIKNNTAELSSHYDGLIPGVKGAEVLETFMLDKKYGGVMVDLLFRRENPGFDKLSEDERKATTEKWFKGFQGNKKDMAMAAEYGRMKWLVGQMPGIVQHAQKVGASKKLNETETDRGRPSPMTQTSQKLSSGLSEFFGYDSVN